MVIVMLSCRSQVAAVLCCLVASARGFAAGNRAYAATYGSAASVDQAAYESAEFWQEVAAAVPGFNDRPELKRFRGWVANLITKPPGEVSTLETGQEVLTQYLFPGLQASGVDRTPFPSLPEVEAALRAVAPIAQKELDALLLAQPLADDDAAVESRGDAAGSNEDGAVWNRAAWYGWQFMSLRDAKLWMPRTIRALQRTIPLAHRFIGIARQRADCRGTLHSDRRNYLLSTLTGLRVPSNACAVEVPGFGERMLSDGEVVVLDNTFKHVVYNSHASLDRLYAAFFVLPAGLCGSACSASTAHLGIGLRRHPPSWLARGLVCKNALPRDCDGVSFRTQCGVYSTLATEALRVRNP